MSPTPVKRQMYRIDMTFPESHPHEPSEETTYVRGATPEQAISVAQKNHPEADGYEAVLVK